MDDGRDRDEQVKFFFGIGNVRGCESNFLNWGKILLRSDKFKINTSKSLIEVFLYRKGFS